MHELFALISVDPTLDVAIAALFTWLANSSVAIVVVVRDRKDAFQGLDSLNGKLAQALSLMAEKIMERASLDGAE